MRPRRTDRGIVQAWVGGLVEPEARGEGIDDDLQCKYYTMQLGDCLLQLAQPLEEDSHLGRHVAKWGNMIYSLRWKVRDLDAAAAWLNSQGVRTERLRDNLLQANEEDTFGAPMFFTTEDIPGDPFADQAS